MGKVNERRQNILKYIQDKGTVSTKDLLEIFQIHKATLSEDLSALKSQGVPLETSYGTVCLNPNQSVGYYEKITVATMRHWFILLILSQSRLPLNFETIRAQYINLAFDCSIDTLHKDLQFLQKQGYVILNPTNFTYLCTKKFPTFISPSMEELDDFCYQYVQRSESHPVDLELTRVHKIATILNCGFEDANVYDKNDTYIVHGKRNLIDSASKDLLNRFLLSSYKSNILSICYTTNKGRLLSADFSVGLIVYSIEKNKIYLLGETPRHRTVIPLDSIKKFEDTERKNTIYNSALYHQIYQEMFSISVEDPYNVRIRFANQSFIFEKIKNLHSNRSLSTFCLSDDGTEIIYTDTIRGISDFSNYLRQFGRSVIVDEPLSLREQMIQSAEMIIANYRKEFHYE